MNALEYLSEIKSKERYIKIKRNRLKVLRQGLELKGVRYDSIGSASSTHTGFDDKVCLIVDAEKEIADLEYQLGDMKIEAVNAIDKLENDNEKEVLTRMFLLYQPISQIVKEMGYSESRIFVFRREGLKKISVPAKVDSE